MGAELLAKTHIARMATPLHLAGGGILKEWQAAYEAYGVLNAERDNAVLICHALTANAHAAGRHTPADKQPGWWNALIGAGKPFDTERFFVVCANVLGGCGGSTGPASPHPGDGRPYALRFPVVTIADMVDAQACLADQLGIRSFHAAAGGCLGGFQVLEWMARCPGRLRRAIVIGATPRTSAYTMALWHVMRAAIRLDPDFRNGDYYETGRPPLAGVNLGTAVGMLIRMSAEVMERKFARRLTRGARPGYTLAPEFEIEDFFRRIGQSGAGRCDANSLIYLTRAMDYFDLTAGGESLREVLRGFHGSTLLISYRSDWRYPPEQVDEIRAALAANGAPCEHRVLDSDFGHGAFIYDNQGVGDAVRNFLR